MEILPAQVIIPAGDSLFFIDNNIMPMQSELFMYGCPSIGHLDLRVSFLGALILGIECMYASNNVEMDMHLGEPEERELRQEKYAYFYAPEGIEDNYCGSFQIAYTNKEAVVVLSDRTDIEHFVRSGRVEYYYTEDEILVYIRIRNLGKSEYLALHGIS